MASFYAHYCVEFIKKKIEKYQSLQKQFKDNPDLKNQKLNHCRKFLDDLDRINLNVQDNELQKNLTAFIEENLKILADLRAKHDTWLIKNGEGEFEAKLNRCLKRINSLREGFITVGLNNVDFSLWHQENDAFLILKLHLVEYVATKKERLDQLSQPYSFKKWFYNNKISAAHDETVLGLLQGIESIFHSKIVSIDLNASGYNLTVYNAIATCIGDELREATDKKAQIKFSFFNIPCFLNIKELLGSNPYLKNKLEAAKNQILPMLPPKQVARQLAALK